MKNLSKISNLLRKEILKSVYYGGGGHIGGSFSIIDILVYLYYKEINITKKNINSIKRDRLIFSKGHSCLALYWILINKGIVNKSIIQSYGKNNSILAGHPEHDKIPGIEISTGSLGHGPSIGCGIAYASKLKNIKNKVYVIVGDGEMNEGSIWESFLFAAQHNLNNLTIVIDNNRYESLNRTENIMGLEPLESKLIGFNFNVERCNGHNFKEIKNKIEILKNKKNLKPNILIADTIKAKGVSFMEGDSKWHYRQPSKEEFNLAYKELS